MSLKIRAKKHGNASEEDGGTAYREAIRRTHADRPDLRGWTYTHDWVNPTVIEWRDTLPTGIGVVASCDSLAQAREAIDLGWRAVAVLVPTEDGEHFTRSEAQATRSGIKHAIPRANVALPCPATLVHAPDIGCADCVACHTAPHKQDRVTVIVFPAHSGARRAALDTEADGGCYGQQGNCAMHEGRAGRTSTDFYKWGASLPPDVLVRWSVTGDLSNGRSLPTL